MFLTLQTQISALKMCFASERLALALFKKRLALPNLQKYNKIILKGKLVLKASTCSVIPFKPKMFDGLVLLSHFNGIYCNQTDLCPALFRHSHF